MLANTLFGFSFSNSEPKESPQPQNRPKVHLVQVKSPSSSVYSTPERRRTPSKSLLVDDLEKRVSSLESANSILVSQNGELTRELATLKLSLLSSHDDDEDEIIVKTMEESSPTPSFTEEIKEELSAQILQSNLMVSRNKTSNLERQVSHYQMERSHVQAILAKCADIIETKLPLPEEKPSVIATAECLALALQNTQAILTSQHGRILSLLSENTKLKSQRQTTSLVQESMSRIVRDSMPRTQSNVSIESHQADSEMATLLQSNVQLQNLNDSLTARLESQVQLNAEMKSLIVNASLGAQSSSRSILDMYNDAQMEIAQLREELDIVKSLQ